MNIFEELKARGLVFQTTDEEALVKALTEGQVSYYSGYDPTADSLHLGIWFPFLVMPSLTISWAQTLCSCWWCYRSDWRSIFLEMRNVSLQTKDTVDGWVTRIQGQLLVSWILKW